MTGPSDAWRLALVTSHECYYTSVANGCCCCCCGCCEFDRGKPLASPERGGPPLRFFIPAAFGRAGSEGKRREQNIARHTTGLSPDQPKKAHHCQPIPRGTRRSATTTADNFVPPVHESRCVSRSTSYLTPDCTSQLLPPSASLCTILIRLHDCPYPFSFSTLPFPFLACQGISKAVIELL